MPKVNSEVLKRSQKFYPLKLITWFFFRVPCFFVEMLLLLEDLLPVYSLGWRLEDERRLAINHLVNMLKINA